MEKKIIIGFVSQNGQLESKGETNFRSLVNLDNKFFAPKNGNTEYTDCSGNLTGITTEMVESGIGRYDDDTKVYYTKEIDSLDAEEWEALFKEEGDRPSSLDSEMIAYLEKENDLTIKGKKLTLSLKDLKKHLDSEYYSQEEFEEEFYEDEED